MIPLDPRTEERVQSWLNGDYDLETKEEIKHLQKTNPKELNDAFYTDLSFGTGGLRGIMGIGSNRMNVYTVRAATQGLANYLLTQTNQTPSVLIGYDSRHNSKLFAEESARVLAGNGITAYIYREMRPSPLVSFGCRYKKCQAGIMITASHNPPEYNGYKVYWADGSQVLPPHDENIIKEVQKIKNPSQVKRAANLNDPSIVFIGEEVDDAYFKAIAPQQIDPTVAKNGNLLKIVYTSLHGTGITLVPKALEKAGFSQIFLVDEQVIPNGDFPTVKFPNPEEKEALQMGIDKLKKVDGDLLIATDPDTDRIGIATLHKGNIVLINGNQFACLCLEYILHHQPRQNKLPEKGVFVKTIATTELFKTISEANGKPCIDVLTGFKYIAEKIREWEQSDDGTQFVFGGEESYGYLLGTHARDKDAVSAAVLIAEVALSAKIHSKTLVDLLEEIYKKYGFYYEKLATFEFPDNKEGKEKISKMMSNLRHNPPTSLNGIKVEWIEDYQNLQKTHLPTQRKEALHLQKSNVLLYWLEDETKIMIRPSGTEPKIKIYCGVKEPYTSLKESQARCEQKANGLIQSLQNLTN